MRLCIPTRDGRGLEGRLASHFGSAPYFTFVDTESGDCEVVAHGHGHGHGHHGEGACGSAGVLRDRGAEAVVCRGLGKRAYAGLQQAGIEVYVSPDPTAADALASFRAGTLATLRSEDACRGGHHHRGRHGRHRHRGQQE